MIRLSANVIYEFILILKMVDKYELTTKNCYDGLDIKSCNIDKFIKTMVLCDLLCVVNNIYTITQVGRDIIKKYDESKVHISYRLILKNYIINIKPAWAFRFPYGRKESTLFMSKDEQACFWEACLLEPYKDSSVIAWWDEISEIIRCENNSSKVKIGRNGEKLTVEYEEKRTRYTPDWVSIDSNLLGYDIISRSSFSDNTPLLIEVKTSNESIENAHFYLSKNEWLVSSTTKNYKFYLWNIRVNKKYLAVLEPIDIKYHIPTNNMSGQWETVKIPFSCFKEYFIEIV